jgi:hypothetical protein
VLFAILVVAVSLDFGSDLVGQPLLDVGDGPRRSFLSIETTLSSLCR